MMMDGLANPEALVVFGTKVCLETNSEETECMVMSGGQNAVQNGT